MTHLSRLLVAASLFAAAAGCEGKAQESPITIDTSGSVTGFSTDAILESGGSSNGDLSGDPTGASSYVLVTAGYAAAHPIDFDATAAALPDDGKITGPTGVVFRLQPYDQANVLVVNGDSPTLTLAPSAQASYSEISFLVSSLTPTSRSSAINFTLNYTDGTMIPLSTDSTVPSLTSDPSQLNLTQPVVAATLDSYVLAGFASSTSGPIYLDEYDFAISAPPSEILQSVKFDSNDQFDVYALSGTDPTPEPPAWLLFMAALGALVFAARRLKRCA